MTLGSEMPQLEANEVRAMLQLMTDESHSRLRVGDRVNIPATVREIRQDGTLVLTVAASTSLIPAVILTNEAKLLQASGESTPLAADVKAGFPIGLAVTNKRGDQGRVCEPDVKVPRVRRLAARQDALMVHWQGRSLPTWEAPEDIVVR